MSEQVWPPKKEPVAPAEEAPAVEEVKEVAVEPEFPVEEPVEAEEEASEKVQTVTGEEKESVGPFKKKKKKTKK